MPPYSVTVHDPSDDTDDEVAEIVALVNEVVARVLPDEAPATVADAVAARDVTPDRARQWSFRARDEDGCLVATARTAVDPDHDENPDLLFVGITVHPDHRRRGIGTRLLRGLLDLAVAEGRTRILSGTMGSTPDGAAFAAHVGATVKARAHQNRLLTVNADRAQLESWVQAAAGRSGDYELVTWDGPVPDPYLDHWIDLVHVMNTAPRDDLEVNDFTLTPDLVREYEHREAAVGAEQWTIVATHTGSGEWAGYHNVEWLPSDPNVVWVASTAVEPSHRGHALGKWLKAVMMLRILDERPDITEVRTDNADSNDAMLAINRAMGYEPWIARTTWELDVAEARRALA